jgi:multidrug efflux system membrane fusion protein
MNAKVVTAGVAALGLVLGAYAYREPLTSSITGLFKGKPETAAVAPRDNSGTPAARKGRRGSGGAAVSVTVATVEMRPTAQLLTAIGTAQALATVGVKARVDGQLNQAFFEEGQVVKKGQTLFQIDPRPFQVELRQAEANLARDRALFEKTKAELARYKELVDMGYASQQKYEDVKATNAASRAVLAADAAAVDQAKLQLEYTSIKAPIDGRTGSLLVSVGNLVKANDTNPLVVLTQLKPIYVTFSVPEQYLLQLKALMATRQVQVDATIGGDSVAKHRGTLTFINNAVDAATGTIQLKATFPNDDDALTPGAFVNLSLTIRERPEAILVPTGALQVGQNGSFVWVVGEDNKVAVRPITVEETTQSYSVISAGLKPGETVVTDGQLNLVPGASVRARGADGGGDSGEGARAPETAATSAAAAGNSGKKRKKKKRSEGDG